MGFLQNLLDQGKRAVAGYSGDAIFLNAATSAAANVTAADGKIDDAEIETAITGMQSNPILNGSFSGAKIEEALGAALTRAKTRLGRMENKRHLEALSVRPIEQRQDVFLIAADVADNGGIGDDERKVLDDIAKALNVDGAKLLG